MLKTLQKVHEGGVDQHQEDGQQVQLHLGGLRQTQGRLSCCVQWASARVLSANTEEVGVYSQHHLADLHKESCCVLLASSCRFVQGKLLCTVSFVLQICTRKAAVYYSLRLAGWLGSKHQLTNSRRPSYCAQWGKEKWQTLSRWGYRSYECRRIVDSSVVLRLKKGVTSVQTSLVQRPDDRRIYNSTRCRYFTHRIHLVIPPPPSPLMWSGSLSIFSYCVCLFVCLLMF